jgi:hypothetical protein
MRFNMRPQGESVEIMTPSLTAYGLAGRERSGRLLIQLRLERDGWPGVARHSAPAIPIAALNLKAEATARFPDGCQLVDFELLRL